MGIQWDIPFQTDSGEVFTMSNSLAMTLKSSIVKKQLVGVTGLLLCGFLLSHLAGNLLIFVGPEASEFRESFPKIVVMSSSNLTLTAPRSTVI